MDKVIISIVTYNSPDAFETLDQFRSIMEAYPQFELIVHDNHSESDYVSKLKSYDYVTVFEGNENAGFGHGHNENLLHRQGDYALICNPDIVLEKADLDVMLQKIQAQPKVVAVFPSVYNSDGTPQYLVRKQLAVFDYFLRFMPSQRLKRAFSKRLQEFECRDLSETEDSFIKMGSGCLMLVDLAKYQAIGGFDERFFMYFEDNDLCLRLGSKGDRLLYTPAAKIIHHYGKGSHRSFKLFVIFMQSMFKFFNKWGWRFF
ncbi:glycosyltransferase family 2 protein [Enterococcus asini]|uniref:glycosyltransferase family 2 protein n=1 Tax=Enterococcus asini TaxID=57732 RepID=UPI0028923394|nr:glycosyltransferase family 2 protein [Enterococcus asini]MDT2756578.1 glycosyltransferase family 2 protein [Enterococcus asini]